MRKRFVDNDIFRNNWFYDLSPEKKLLFLWLSLNCDMAGVIKINWNIASNEIGHPVCPTDLDAMEDNVKKIAPNKYILPKFIEFQYGNLAEISNDSKSRVYRGVYKCLKSHGLTYPLDI